MTVAESLKHHRMQFLLALLILLGVYWSVIFEMVRQWYDDANYSHGFLVPFVAGYFAYDRRRELAQTLAEPCWPGLLLVVAGLLQLLAGWFATEFFTMRSSLVVTLCGMTLFLLGKRLFRLMLLPLGFLFFMVPLPYIIYDKIAFPLKLFVTRVSIAAMKHMGVVVMHEGNIIMLPHATLEVADACSGIRSLISLLALAVAYAFFLKMSQARRVLLILAAIPIAISANAMRVIGTGLLAQYWGAKAAEGFFHEFAGMAVFVVSVVMMLGVGALLARDKGGAA